MTGSAEVTITPPGSLALAGFDEKRFGLDVLDDLFVKAIIFQKDKKTLVLASLDLLWVSRRFCDDLRKWARRELGIPENSLMVTATHTHSGPQIRELSFDGCPVDKDYMDLVARRTRLALKQAFNALAPAKIEYGSGHTNIAINRRKFIVDPANLKRLRWHHKIANRPNPTGPRDDSLGVVWIKPLNGESVTVLINAACHPSIWRGEMYSADFPGYLGEILTERIGQPVRAVFLQGFSGNLKCRLKRRMSLKVWPPGRLFETLFDRIQFEKNASSEKVREVAEELAADILEVELLPFKEARFDSREVEANLSLEELPTVESLRQLSELPDHVQSSYGAYLLDHYGELGKVSVRVQCLDFGPSLCLVGVEGEVFCEYALWLRKRWKQNRKLVMTVGCCGGMVGYIPDEASHAQGGYEVERSLMTFGLPSGFSPQLEEKIKEALDAIKG